MHTNAFSSPASDSPLIVGAMRLGEWGAKLSTSDMQAFIEGCLERGLKDFDHADIYGGYTTEAEFGAVLKAEPGLRERLRLTTKFGIRMLSDNRPEHGIKHYDSSADHMVKSVENSLSALHTDYLDVVLLHRPDILLDPRDLTAAVEKLISAGKVRAFGVSNFTPAQFEMLHEFFPLCTNQVEASLLHLEPFVDGTFVQCQRLNVVPTAWSPLGGGALFNPADERSRRINDVAAQIATAHAASIDQILLAWLLRHPARIIPVLGTSKISRIDSALGALEIKLSREEWYRLWTASTGQEVA